MWNNQTISENMLLRFQLLVLLSTNQIPNVEFLQSVSVNRDSPEYGKNTIPFLREKASVDNNFSTIVFTNTKNPELDRKPQPRGTTAKILDTNSSTDMYDFSGEGLTITDSYNI